MISGAQEPFWELFWSSSSHTWIIFECTAISQMGILAACPFKYLKHTEWSQMCFHLPCFIHQVGDQPLIYCLPSQNSHCVPLAQHWKHVVKRNFHKGLQHRNTTLNLELLMPCCHLKSSIIPAWSCVFCSF